MPIGGGFWYEVGSSYQKLDESFAERVKGECGLDGRGILSALMTDTMGPLIYISCLPPR